MKINKEQFDVLIAKLDWLMSTSHARNDAFKDVQQQYAAIEQGQAVLCERLDTIIRSQNSLTVSIAAHNANHKGLKQGLDAIQGELLLGQFRKGQKPLRIGLVGQKRRRK